MLSNSNLPTPAGHNEDDIPRASDARTSLYIAFALAAVVLSVFSGVVRGDFIELDDRAHILENPVVANGLGWDALKSAFSRPHASLWIPLTWISLMVDVTIFGMNPGALHAVNLLMHTCATILLFSALRRLTGKLWESAMVAALFGLHPINVESVAWLTERKNVLCAVFWMATLLAYARYAEHPTTRRYLGVFVMVFLALLSKPMAVTLPASLFLLDIWPLQRHATLSFRRLVVEKIPFFALGIFGSWMQMRAVDPERISISVKVCNAVESYAFYLGDLFWPTNLGIYYPYRMDTPMGAVFVTSALLITLSIAAWAERRSRPYILFGWCWFLGNLVPMSGIVQVGGQARADRFTYIAQVGIFIAVVWFTRSRLGGKLFTTSCFLALATLSIATARQVRLWEDGATLFEHTARVTNPNPRASSLAGYSRALRGEYSAALPHYYEALKHRPDDSETLNNLGAALTRLGKYDQALTAFSIAFKLRPDEPTARQNLIRTLRKADKQQEAIELLLRLSVLFPEAYDVHIDLAAILSEEGETDESARHVAIAERLKRKSSSARRPSE